jgi:hypothetical protein
MTKLAIRTWALAAACAATMAMLAVSADAAGPQWTYPAITGFGPVHPLPDAAVQPSKSTIYKSVFDVTSASKDGAKPNPGLDHVARAVNVFASAGVPLSHLQFVAVIHGPATASVLADEHTSAQTWRRARDRCGSCGSSACCQRTGRRTCVCRQKSIRPAEPPWHPRDSAERRFRRRGETSTISTARPWTARRWARRAPWRHGSSSTARSPAIGNNPRRSQSPLVRAAQSG